MVFICSFSVCSLAKNQIKLSYPSKASQILPHFFDTSSLKNTSSQKVDTALLGASTNFQSVNNSNVSSQWKRLKARLKQFRQISITEDLKIQLSTFKSKPLDQEQRQILEQDPRFLSKLSEGFDPAKGYGISLKFELD